MEEIRYLQKNKNSHPNFGHNNINFDLRFTKLILIQLKKNPGNKCEKINTARRDKLAILAIKYQHLLYGY